MLYAIVFIPLFCALVSWFFPDNRYRPVILPGTALVHLVLTGMLVAAAPPPSIGGWIWLDPLGCIVLLCISVLNAICSWYAVGFLRFHDNRPNRLMCVCMLVCLSAMTVVTMAQHLGMFWVAMETTTLTMAPLIYFNRNASSIEATWKYLMICSVGIALAFLGLMFLAYSTYVAHRDATLLLGTILSSATDLNKDWLHAAFAFLVVGYGTKMGLAPLHIWKPDTYGESPGIVGALLAGGLVNCAFLALVRIFQVCIASGSDIAYFQNIMVGLGLISMATAGVFMIKQPDFKRMLAYSSVEHMGILSIGLGLGKGALFATLFHIINNGLTKGVLFLSAGNIQQSYSSKTITVVRGALTRLPWSGGLFLAGIIAITGSPPFSTFISEFGIADSAFSQGRYVTGGLYLLFLMVIFIGTTNNVIPLVMGRPSPDTPETPYKDKPATVAPLIAVMLLVLVLGVWQPPFLVRLLESGADMLRVKP
jgi:hydrogenase-4 component F